MEQIYFPPHTQQPIPFPGKSSLQGDTDKFHDCYKEKQTTHSYIIQNTIQIINWVMDRTYTGPYFSPCPHPQRDNSSLPEGNQFVSIKEMFYGFY